MSKRILFLGVGGIGVSALAFAAKNLGFEVSGYDLKSNDLTSRLESLGANIFSDFDDIKVSNYDMIVYSSAFPTTHHIITEAQKLNTKCLQRAMFLAILMDDFSHSIAVTGTHGKTTTSSILATMLSSLDPSSSFVVGGEVKHSESNMEINGTDKLVLEADESDASFLYLNPQSAIITNIDLDHMSTYQNSYDTLLDNFYNFASKESIESLYICIDDSGCKDLLSKYSLDKNIITYGFAKDSDAVIDDYRIEGSSAHFSISCRGNNIGLSTLLPGNHNVLNAAVCVVKCLDLGFKISDIQQSLATVEGVKRRFDIYKKTINGINTTVVDDYGHHPAEVECCLSAMKDRFPGKDIIHIFQPHRYSRNRDLFDDWIRVLNNVDKLILMPTYAASEEHDESASSKELAKHLPKCTVVTSFDEAIIEIEKIIDSNSVVLTQGAGDITNLVGMLDD